MNSPTVNAAKHPQLHYSTQREELWTGLTWDVVGAQPQLYLVVGGREEQTERGEEGDMK